MGYQNIEVLRDEVPVFLEFLRGDLESRATVVGSERRAENFESFYFHKLVFQIYGSFVDFLKEKMSAIFARVLFVVGKSCLGVKIIVEDDFVISGDYDFVSPALERI